MEEGAHERFTLKLSEKSGYLVCTDTINMIVCVFKEHHFNEDQKFTLLNDEDPSDYMKIARFTREMGDWLRENHYNRIF